MKATKRQIAVVVIVCAALALAGCAAFQSHTTRRASVVDYLYPKKAEPVEVPGATVMSLPLRVGVAFVPETHASSDAGYMAWAPPRVGAFPESKKMELLQAVSREFKQLPYIKSVELIPTQYLTPGGGFDNLDQIRTMFGLDLIALLSYDQAQFTDEGWPSLTYWTLVGAYVVRGERNDTVTMIDAAVYHIPNRKLLFRAPGTSRIKGAATPINLSEQLRLNSQAGFEAAASNLVVNLQTELGNFKTKIKEAPAEYKVEAKPGYDLKAMGGLDGLTALLAVIIGGMALWTRKQL